MDKASCRGHTGWAGITLLVAAALGACAGTVPERHYRLLAAGSTAPLPAAPAATPPVVAVAAVSVPELVDRPQIVTVGPRAQVYVSEQERWAEPLKLAIGRLVAERLAAALGGALVWSYPTEAGVEPAYSVSLAVQRFESEPGVAAHTSVLWTVRRLDDGRTRVGRGEQRTATADASLDALAAAHAQALAGFADEIAREIAALAQAAR